MQDPARLHSKLITNKQAVQWEQKEWVVVWGAHVNELDVMQVAVCDCLVHLLIVSDALLEVRDSLHLRLKIRKMTLLVRTCSLQTSQDDDAAMLHSARAHRLLLQHQSLGCSIQYRLQPRLGEAKAGLHLAW